MLARSFYFLFCDANSGPTTRLCMRVQVDGADSGQRIHCLRYNPRLLAWSRFLSARGFTLDRAGSHKTLSTFSLWRELFLRVQPTPAQYVARTTENEDDKMLKVLCKCCLRVSTGWGPRTGRPAINARSPLRINSPDVKLRCLLGRHRYQTFCAFRNAPFIGTHRIPPLRQRNARVKRREARQFRLTFAGVKLN